MSLNAKYEADFTDFYSAVAQATTSLESMEQSGVDVEKQMDDVAKSLTNAPVKGDIDGMASSMDEFGVKSAQTMDDIGSKTGGLSAAFLQVGGAIAAAFTVQQVGAFLVGVMDTASAIGDLSAQIGISTDAVQRFSFAADQSGSSIDNVGKSIQTMNNKLTEGGKGTIAALGQLGLDLDELKNSGPEQAFIAIGDAIAGIDDPMERTRLAMELFGKSGAENIQMFLEGVEKVGAQTAVMSEETIKRLKSAQDAWSQFKNNVVIYTGEALGAIGKFFDAWQDGSAKLAVAMNPFQAIPKVIQDFDLSADAAVQSAAELGMQLSMIEPPIKKVGEGLKPVALNAEQVDAAIGWLNVTLVKAKDAVSLVEPKLGTLAAATRDFARGTDDLDKLLKATAASTDVFNSGLVFTSEVIGELPQQFDAVTKSIGDMQAAQERSAGAQMGTSTPGGTINTGGITIGSQWDVAELVKQFGNKYGGASGIGMIGGGPPPDFLSWALSMGYATKGGPSFPAGGNVGAPVNQTINMNGLLGTNDPATRELIKSMVGDAMVESMRGQRLLSSA